MNFTRLAIGILLPFHFGFGQTLDSLPENIAPTVPRSTAAKGKPGTPDKPINSTPTARVALWPGKAPVGAGKFEDSDLELEVFLPPADKANGAAIVLCPGGGYIRHVTDCEGYSIA